MYVCMSCVREREREREREGGGGGGGERERERGEGEREREAKRRLVTKSTYPLYTCRHTKTHETEYERKKEPTNPKMTTNKRHMIIIHSFQL